MTERSQIVRVLYAGPAFELVEVQAPEGRQARLLPQSGADPKLLGPETLSRLVSPAALAPVVTRGRSQDRPAVFYPLDGVRALGDLAPLSDVVALAVAVELAEALAEAHATIPSAAHLPLGPKLLMLGTDGSLKCLGFGFSDVTSSAMEDAAALGRTLSSLAADDAPGVGEVVQGLARTTEKRPDFGLVAQRARSLLAARSGLDSRAVLATLSAQNNPQPGRAAKLFDFALAPEDVPDPAPPRPRTVLVSEEAVVSKLASSRSAPDRSPTVSSGDPAITFTGSTDERLRGRERAAQQVELGEEEEPLGLVLHGFRLDELLGSGTFANVYRARHLYLGRELAVKILKSRFASSEIARRRMIREADALSRLDHPNVVSVRDFGFTPAGLPFLVMELVQGRTLKSLLKAEAPLASDRASALTRQLARGLFAVHSIGLVHRDLKPSNILVLEQDGKEILKILDFGVVRNVDGGAENTQLTRARDLIGTPKYMAPEQIGAASEAGPEADLYAVGTILYEMLSGQAPFLGPTKEEVLDQHRHVSPAPLAQSGPLGEVALRLLAKRPEDRIRGSAALLEAIDSALGPDELSAPTTTSPDPRAFEPTYVPTVTSVEPDAPPKNSPTVTMTRTKSSSASGRPSATNAVLVGAVAAATFSLGVWWSPRAIAPAPFVDFQPLQPEPETAVAAVAAPNEVAAPSRSEPELPEGDAEATEDPEDTRVKGRPAKKPTSRPTITRAAVDARFRSLLERRGLAPDELKLVVDARLVDAYISQRSEPEAASTALDALASALERATVDKRLFDRKLGVLRSKIRELASAVPRDDLDAFDERYRELKKRAVDGADFSVVKELMELERKVDAAAGHSR
ncbi:MAG: protein kinase [Deltaproteobacteria bacterium]|nr:protein kinase [Deltaproteobacteria bacterium]